MFDEQKILRMSNEIIATTSTVALSAFLLNPADMITFEFHELTTILVEMWADSRIVLRKSLIDFVIITAINQRRPKGITRRQYIELAYLLVPKKIEKASREIIEGHANITGFCDYI